ncbi:MAG: hypothetical protein AUG87_14960 [Candidatus Rokubacteria bacterium 13_1_20CM_4_70_14]|nr:MAG: hypothetical protein AUG87_14960 [Candidatus Rokubacteria bacterium 13_1_20CM_4_70_14]
MLRGIDHIVIAVPDLAAAGKSYAALGFTVVPGGRHPVGTHNALIAFGDGSYVELIAFYENNPAHKWWAPLQAGGGLVDFCMQTDDLRGDTEAFRKAGVSIDDPAPLSRVRPDGYQLRWVLSIPRGAHRGVAPFLIQDETPREERVPRETTHPNGVTGIGTVTVAVPDVPPVARWYAEVLRRPGRGRTPPRSAGRRPGLSIRRTPSARASPWSADAVHGSARMDDAAREGGRAAPDHGPGGLGP